MIHHEDTKAQRAVGENLGRKHFFWHWHYCTGDFEMGIDGFLILINDSPRRHGGTKGSGGKFG